MKFCLAVLLFSVFIQAISSSAETQEKPDFVPDAWVQYDPLYDDFNGNSLDSSKWANYYIGGWKGRQPGLFVQHNVKVSNGNLELWARHEAINSSSDRQQGYHDFTTSCVSSQGFLPQTVYTEVRAKSGTSKITSSFWFAYSQNTNNGQWWTEIDVIESSGPLEQQSYYYDTLSSHTHIWKLPGVSEQDLPGKCKCKLDGNGCTKANSYKPSFPNFSDDFHIFGLRRDPNSLQISLDGKVIWNTTNSCCHEQMRMIFDRETFFWGNPSYNVLPDQPYMIDYVHTWVPPS